MGKDRTDLRSVDMIAADPDALGSVMVPEAGQEKQENMYEKDRS